MKGADSIGITHQRGFALPMALIILAMLMVMSLGLSRMAKSHLEYATQQKSSWQDELLIYNAFQQLLFSMFSGRIDVDTLYADKITLPLDGQWVQFAGVQVKFQDRNGLIPLQANPGILARLLEAYVAKPQAVLLARRIADWIDVDSLPRVGGMERADYVAAGLHRVPRNGPMRSLDELLEVPGVTVRMYQGDLKAGLLGLRDILVLQLRMPGFNVATAPAVLLEPVLGLGQSGVAQLLQARNHKRWAQVKEIIGLEKMGEEISLIPGNDYTVMIRTPSGHEARIGVRFTYTSRKPYEILSWYYPDYEQI